MAHSGTIRPSSFLLLGLSAALAGCSEPGAATRDTPAAQYDATSGRLRQLTFDSTRNGRNDAVGIMDGARVERIEVDENEDGTIDRWEFYDENRALEKTGFSRRDDGVMDQVVTYGTDGAVARVEISTRSDGRFDRLELYSAQSLARVEEDTDRDGRVDKWETYAVNPLAAPGQRSLMVTAAFDDLSRGTPSRRLVYRPDGTVLRAEVDPDGDGAFETVTASRRE